MSDDVEANLDSAEKAAFAEEAATPITEDGFDGVEPGGPELLRFAELFARVALVAFIIGYALFVLQRRLRKKRGVPDWDGSFDDMLDAMGRMKWPTSLPPPVAEYEDLRDQQTSGNDEICSVEDQPVMRRALVRRACSMVPLIERLEKEGQGIDRMYKRGLCNKGDFEAFKAHETLVVDEIHAVRDEAEWIDRGHAGSIWPAARQIHQKAKDERAAKLASANGLQGLQGGFLGNGGGGGQPGGGARPAIGGGGGGGGQPTGPQLMAGPLSGKPVILVGLSNQVDCAHLCVWRGWSAIERQSQPPRSTPHPPY